MTAKRAVLTAMLACLVWHALATRAAGDPTPARSLASAAAQRLEIGDASEYWDLTIELEDGQRVVARFLVTNQGPGVQNGTAVGYVISTDGRTTKFRNGRLESGWTLSDDGLDLDIGKTHLDMHLPRYTLKVNKSEARIRIHFAPNALYTLPGKLGGRKYRVDLLALGARAEGTLQLEGMEEKIPVTGWATLTHTTARDKESDLALRRIEVISQRGERPFYAAEFLDPGGDRNTVLAWLDPGCDPASSPEPLPAGTDDSTAGPAPGGPNTGPPCLRKVVAKRAVGLALGDPRNRAAKRGGKNSYWIPPVIFFGESKKSNGTSTDKEQQISGRVVVGEPFLVYQALDDLPGPIRFLAAFSTRPRRVWSEARFEVTLPPTLDSKPISIQGQGVATVSFTNPVTNP